MLIRSQQLTKEFKDFKSGNIEALQFILSSERERLFDYVMRMTGQLVKSGDVTEEALAAIEQSADDSDTLQELLITVYKTSRNFASDVWSAETSKLENSAYSGNQGKDAQALITVESVVRTLPPLQREVLLLRDRYGFALDEVAEITGRPSTEVEMIFARALSALEAAMPEHSTRLAELLQRMVVFVKPQNDGPATQNLSMIMNDFKKTERLSSPRSRWVKLAAYAAVALGVWLYRSDLVEFFETTIQPHLDSFFGARSGGNL